MKKDKAHQKVDELAKKLAKLVEIFRQGQWDSDYHWWGSQSPQSIFNPDYGYQDGQVLFEKLVQGVLDLNPEMLSRYEVENKLVYYFLKDQTISVNQLAHLSNQSLVDEAKKYLNDLIEFQAWQNVDIPIANLWLEGESFKLGYTTFVAATEQDLEKWKSNPTLWPSKAPEVHVLVQVKAPGDMQKALSYAMSQADLTLDVLRAFCFPFGRRSDTWRIGVVGDIIPWASTPIRINNRNFVTRLGPGIAQIELRKHILSKLEQSQWQLVDKIILKPQDSLSNMESKLRDGIHWLAESTKPDTNNSKFAKISFALETLIGGESKDEDLKVRGITAMLAERAAFIVGKDLNDRIEIDRDIRKYYGKRGSIVHGGEEDASLEDIDKFGELVRRLSLALLDKLDELGDEISDVEKLERWVRKQRYTVPSSNQREVS